MIGYRCCFFAAAFIILQGASALELRGASSSFSSVQVGSEDDAVIVVPSETASQADDEAATGPGVIVCNAYAGEGPMRVALRAGGSYDIDGWGEGPGVAYGSCREGLSSAQSGDVLSFSLPSGVSGNFEVHTGPSAAGPLLVVLERAPGPAPIVSFQSFTFPALAAGDGAQVAVIDAFHGQDGDVAQLMLRASGTDIDGALGMNRVYTINAGRYDAAIVDQAAGQDATTAIDIHSRQRYAFVRVGDSRLTPQSLVIYPPPSEQGLVVEKQTQAIVGESDSQMSAPQHQNENLFVQQQQITSQSQVPQQQPAQQQQQKQQQAKQQAQQRAEQQAENHDEQQETQLQALKRMQGQAQRQADQVAQQLAQQQAQQRATQKAPTWAMQQARVQAQLMTESARQLEQRQVQLQAEQHAQQEEASRASVRRNSTHVHHQQVPMTTAPPLPRWMPLPLLPGMAASESASSIASPTVGGYADWGGAAFTRVRKMHKNTPPELPPDKVPIPCWVGCTPCGDVAYEDPVHHPLFGDVRVPPRDEMRVALEGFRATFAMVMLGTGIVVGLLIVMDILHPNSRADIRDLFDPLYPRADDPYPKYVAYQDSIDQAFKDDPIFSQDDWTDNCNNSLSPTSPDFIAPGNIYRVCAVLTPDHGVSPIVWMKWASQAGVVSYMQFSVPMQILALDLTKWHCTGVKTPLWFVYNPMVMAAFASLFSLFHAFAGKCVSSISDGARANYFIAANFCQEDDKYRRLSKFFCCYSLIMNVVCSLLLQACMFVKVSTYSGDMGDAALCAIALYFVFDLDDKIMQANPGLRDRYRRAVISEVRESMKRRDDGQAPKSKGEQPQWLLSVGGAMCVVVGALSPIYLYFIFFLAWRNPTTGQEIGGDPF